MLLLCHRGPIICVGVIFICGGENIICVGYIFICVGNFFLSTSTGENIICIGVIIICGGENIICVGGKLCILFLSALAKISSALAIFSSVLAKISCALVKISCALAEIACALAKISCVVAVFSSVLVGNYVHCKSPMQIFPTKTSPLLALILFRKYSFVERCSIDSLWRVFLTGVKCEYLVVLLVT